jgi:hypothetical protein
MLSFANSFPQIILLLLSATCFGSSFQNEDFILLNTNQEYVRSNKDSNKIIIQDYFARSPPEIEIKSLKNGESCYLNNLPCKKSGKIPLVLSQAKHPEIFELKLTRNSGTHSYHLQILPDDYPSLITTGKSRSKSPFVFSILPNKSNLRTCHLFVLNSKGALDFYRKLDLKCLDFRPHRIGDQTYFSYFETGFLIDGSSIIGTRVVLDPQFNPLLQIDNLDCHEFILISVTHWIQIKTFVDRLDDRNLFMNKEIQEISDGNIIFRWNLKDYLAQFPNSIFPSAGFVTYLTQPAMELIHLNSIQRVNPDSLLIGMADSGVALLNKKSRRVEWILGGDHDDFGLTKDQWFAFSHTPNLNLVDNKLLLFENRNSNSVTDYSTRVIEYDLDLPRKKIVGFRATRPGLSRSFITGSVQGESGNLWTISYGNHFDEAPDFQELENLKETWSLRIQDKLFTNYRLYREPMGE